MTAHSISDFSLPLGKQIKEATRMGATFVVICKTPEEAFECRRLFLEAQK